ncbi:hypothetical protein CR51_22055 [Caballeronia megalochromosomata]|nr:hypothetical protein CR51_22055 [Caballeronia megalochromosomata]
MSCAGARSMPLFQFAPKADVPHFLRAVEAERSRRMSHALVSGSDTIYSDLGSMMFATRASDFRIFPRSLHALTYTLTRRPKNFFG